MIQKETLWLSSNSSIKNEGLEINSKKYRKFESSQTINETVESISTIISDNFTLLEAELIYEDI